MQLFSCEDVAAGLTDGGEFHGHWLTRGDEGRRQGERR